MDSKMLRRALLAVTLFVLAVFVMILMLNGYGSKKKKPAMQVATEVDDEVCEEDGRIKDADLKAWQYDETFFDPDGVMAKYARDDSTLDVMLSATSIEKDMRIRMLDENGHAVSGKVFSVDISGIGRFKDDDMDGMIYVGDLDPGMYEIMLAKADGINVPSEPITCNVKAKIEYKEIADISYLIKTEADIDAAKEDTAVNDADEESSGNSAVRTAEGAKFGIDVSKYNGNIDWNAVRNDGVSYAIVRCGYRGSSSGSIIVDPFFTTNMEGAAAAGVPVGVYFFTQATTMVEAVEEASAVLNLIKQYDIKYPVFIDSEGAGGNGRADALGVEDRSNICQAFCETIRSGGYKAGIYASKNWFNKRLDITKFSGDDIIWLAEYADEPSYGGTFQMWQYSSGGRINGIEGRVDMNLCYLDIESDDSDGDSKESNEVKDKKDEDIN